MHGRCHPVPWRRIGRIGRGCDDAATRTATLIGDQPNIIIASRADLSFNDFLVHLTPILAVLLIAPISFWQFTKYGLIVTVVTLVLAWPYIWLRYYAS